MICKIIKNNCIVPCPELKSIGVEIVAKAKVGTTLTLCLPTHLHRTEASGQQRVVSELS